MTGGGNSFNFSKQMLQRLVRATNELLLIILAKHALGGSAFCCTSCAEWAVVDQSARTNEESL